MRLVHLHAASDGRISAVACALTLAWNDLVHGVTEDFEFVFEPIIYLFMRLNMVFRYLSEVQLAELAVSQLLGRTTEFTAGVFITPCVNLFLQLLLGFLCQRL